MAGLIIFLTIANLSLIVAGHKETQYLLTALPPVGSHIFSIKAGLKVQSGVNWTTYVLGMYCIFVFVDGKEAL